VPSICCSCFSYRFFLFKAWMAANLYKFKITVIWITQTTSLSEISQSLWVAKIDNMHARNCSVLKRYKIRQIWPEENSWSKRSIKFRIWQPYLFGPYQQNSNEFCFHFFMMVSQFHALYRSNGKMTVNIS
jgi:hypothetical protein